MQMANTLFTFFENYRPAYEIQAKKAFTVINDTEEWYGVKDLPKETLKILLQALSDPEGHKCTFEQVSYYKNKLLRLIFSSPKSVLENVFAKNNEITSLFLDCFFIEIVQSLTSLDLAINEAYADSLPQNNTNNNTQEKTNNNTDDEELFSCFSSDNENHTFYCQHGANNAIFENDMCNASHSRGISSSGILILNEESVDEQKTYLLNNNTNNESDNFTHHSNIIITTTDDEIITATRSINSGILTLNEESFDEKYPLNNNTNNESNDFTHLSNIDITTTDDEIITARNSINTSNSEIEALNDESYDDDINELIFGKTNKLDKLKEHIIISTIAVNNFTALKDSPKLHVELLRGLIFHCKDLEMRKIPEYNELYKLILNTVDYEVETQLEIQNEEYAVI